MPMNINYITIITLGSIKKKNLKPKKKWQNSLNNQASGRAG